MGARTAVLCSFLLTAAACGDEFGPEPDGPDQAPVFDDVAFTTDEDTPLTQTLTATDPDGDAVEIAITDPVNGTLERTGASITYTPDANWHGTERLTVTVTAGGRSTAGRVTIIVEPVNDAPVAADDTLAGLAEDTVQIVLPVTVIANDTDIDGDTLTVSAVGSATGGTVALSGSAIAFTPAANFSGNATFEYTVSDGAATDTGTVTLQITGDNDPPVADADEATTAEDTAVDLTVAELVANDTDPEAQTLSITSVGGAVNGTVAQDGTTITFTPAPDFAGDASFTYTVTDGALTDVGTVAVTVTPVNDAPVANDDEVATIQDTALVLDAADLLANDVDVDGPTLTITGVGEAMNGTVALDGTTITFTPDEGFTGDGSFTYTASDGTATDTGTVAVAVIPPTCGNEEVEAGEQCDDGNTDPGDGCSDACQDEFCGDGTVNNSGAETCDDGNADELDGCTTECALAPVCDATAFPGGDAFGVFLGNHHCYVSFDGETVTFAAADAACAAGGGYLVTLTSAEEDAFVASSVLNTAENPWIGATDDQNDTDDVFSWVTGEPWGFTNFAANEPDDDVGFGGNGECLHIASGAGAWADTNCTIDTFVVGYICEIEAICGDEVVEGIETCDDGNADAGDGCSATCQLEPVTVTPGVAAHGIEVVLGGSVTAASTVTTVTIGGVAQTFTINGAGEAVVTALDDATPAGTQAIVVETNLGDLPGTVTVIRLVINEVDSDTPTAPTNDSAEFVEVSTGVPGADLTGYQLVFWNGSNDQAYLVIELGAFADGNGNLLVGNPDLSPTPALTFPINTLQNGADAVSLHAPGVSIANGTAVTAAGLIDAVVYDTSDADDTGLLTTLLGVGAEAAQLDENVNAAGATESISRCGAARLDGRAFVVGTPTPGAANACP